MIRTRGPYLPRRKAAHGPASQQTPLLWVRPSTAPRERLARGSLRTPRTHVCECCDAVVTERVVQCLTSSLRCGGSQCMLCIQLAQHESALWRVKCWSCFRAAVCKTPSVSPFNSLYHIQLVSIACERHHFRRRTLGLNELVRCFANATPACPHEVFGASPWSPCLVTDCVEYC